MKENRTHKRYGRKFWCCIAAFFLFLFMFYCVICKLDLLIDKVDNNACLNPPTCPSQINAVCVDTLITTKRDPLNPKKCVLDTIFQKYYCSQIVVSGIDDENEHQLDSLLENGFEVVRTCACDSIRVFGRSTPLTPEERTKASDGELVDESGGMGSGLNYIIDIPIAAQIIPDAFVLNNPVVSIRENEDQLFQNPIQGDTLWGKRDTTPGDKVKVAIIDTGIDFNHEYLTAYKWRNKNMLQGVNEVDGMLGEDEDGNCYKDDKFGYNFADDSPFVNDNNGHGTHIAGIISKSRNVELMSLKIFNESGGDIFNLACALQYAIDKKSEIINLSLGYYASDTSVILDNAFQKVNEAGILVITSAGNEGYNNDNHIVEGEQLYHFPSSFNQMYDNVLAVAATNAEDKIWKDSNYGKKHVNVAARGKDVVSTYIDPLFQYDGDPPFISLNGTSMAAAQVSAAVAYEIRVGNLGNKQTIIDNALELTNPDTLSFGVVKY